jgi:proline dehydrogenase
MSLWQSAMIVLARSQSITRFMQGNRLMRGLAERFVGGDSSSAAVQRSLEFKARATTTSLYYLGEYVESPLAIEENVAQIAAAIEQLGQTNLDVHVSIDPTQIGYAHSDGLGGENALRLGKLIAAQPPAGRRRLAMLDMEDFTVVRKTLDLRKRLAQAEYPVAITIQAYLFRSGQDVRDLVEDGVDAIRLVKGAFAESHDHAWTKRSEIDREFLQLASYLLSSEARSRGVYPIFATHDERMIGTIQTIAAQNSVAKDDYEFEMLIGVRTPLQRRLVADGYHLRLYLPFGTEWWPYTVRRIGENPANVRFVLNALWKTDAPIRPPGNGV